MSKFVSRSIIGISILLLSASTYMYMNLESSRVQLQSPASGIFSSKPKEKPIARNKYVIRNGSNEMPPGMSQADQPRGISPAGAPDSQAAPTPQPQSAPQAASNPHGSGIDVSQGQGIVPAGASHGQLPGDNAASSQQNPHGSGIDVSQGQGIVPSANQGDSEDLLSEQNLTTNNGQNSPP